MFFKILKKDLQRKKVINAILLVLIILSALFMAASVGSLRTLTNALDYFAELTNESDYILETSDNTGMDEFLRSSELVDGYELNKYIYVTKDFINAAGKGLDMGYYMFSTPNQTHDLLLDSNNNPIFELRDEEIAIPYEKAAKYNLKEGDKLTLTVGDFSKTFVIRYICKDMVYGSTYMGSTRIAVSQNDFDELSNSSIGSAVFSYFITSKNTNALIKSINQKGLKIGSGIDSELVQLCYVVIKLIGAALAAVSIIFIIISFVVLRFTINFAVQEDFREIGIMKAMGIPNGGIRRLYMAKYIVISLIGACFGVAFSFPAEKLVTAQLGSSIPIPDASAGGVLNILCGIAVVLLTTLFCWHCTGKLKKQTAMQAIRSGTSGERFGEKGILSLNRNKSSIPPLFMATNDIFSDLKRYLSLFLIFILCTTLIILPLDLANTLSSANAMTDLFGIVHGDVYVDCKNALEFKNFEDMDNKIAGIETEYAHSGVNVDLFSVVYYSFPVYTENADDSIKITCRQPRGYSASNLTVLEGSAPVLQNEILVTRQIMDRLGVKVGDTVHLLIGGEEREFIISGRFQSMSDVGMLIWLSDKLELDFSVGQPWLTLVGLFKDNTDIEDSINKMSITTPNYKVMDAHSFVMTYLGAVSKQIDTLKAFLLILVLAINSLIAVLMAKTFITKDTGEISLLKSLGFSNRRLRLWQMLRISLIMLAAVLVGVVLSRFIDKPFFSFTFGMMGATDVTVITNPFEDFLLYPAILLAVTTLAAFLATSGIRKISFREINNIDQEGRYE